MISLTEWRIVRADYAKRAEAENQERFDKGIGTLPTHVAINDMMFRDLLSRVQAVEASLTDPKKKG